MMKREKLPIIKYRRRIVLSTSLFTYSILFIALFLSLGSKKMDGGQEIGCYTIFGVLMALSLAWMSWNTYWIVCRSKTIPLTTAILAWTWMPLIGIIANFIILRKIFITHKRDQLAIDPHWKHEHDPMPVVILLVVVTFVVVLAIWLVYASLGHMPDHPDPNSRPDNPLPDLKSIVPGIVDVLLAPINGFISGAEIIIFLLIMGIFMQMVNQSKALEAGIGGLVKKLKGKELIIIPIIMTLFSLGGTIFGMCEETIPFYVIIMPIILAAGFDTITGVLVILFGAGLGVCGSVINPFMIMTSMEAANKMASLSLGISDGIIFRLIIYIVLVATGITFTMIYASRVKKNPQKSLIYDLRDLHLKTFQFDSKAVPELTGKRKIILGIFCSVFIMLILGAIPWDDIFNIEFFQNLDDNLVQKFPFLSTSAGALGTWYLASFALLFLTGAIIIGMLQWTGFNNFYRDCLTGAKDFVNVAFVIAVARGLSNIITDSGINVEITGGIVNVLNINEIFGTIVLFLAFIVLSIFIPSTSGFAFSVFGPIAAPALVGSGYSVCANISSASMANGLANLFSPTAGPFVIGCEMAKVPLKHFYRSAWKLLLIVFFVAIILLVIGIYLPTVIVGK